MNHQTFDVLDPPRSQLRALAALVDQCVANLSADDLASEAVVRLKRAWFDVFKAMALGEEPKLRECPSCNRRIPFEAARCRYCMARSEAQVPAVSAQVER